MSVTLVFPMVGPCSRNTDEREKEIGELMMVCSPQGKLFGSRPRATTRAEQQNPNSASAGRSNEKLMYNVVMISKRCSVKEGTWKMQSPSSLLMPECRDQGVNLGQNCTEIRTAHGQQKYENIVLSLKDEKDLRAAGILSLSQKHGHVDKLLQASGICEKLEES